MYSVKLDYQNRNEWVAMFLYVITHYQLKDA